LLLDSAADFLFCEPLDDDTVDCDNTIRNVKEISRTLTQNMTKIVSDLLLQHQP